MRRLISAARHVLFTQHAARPGIKQRNISQKKYPRRCGRGGVFVRTQKPPLGRPWSGYFLADAAGNRPLATPETALRPHVEFRALLWFHLCLVVSIVVVGAEVRLTSATEKCNLTTPANLDRHEASNAKYKSTERAQIVATANRVFSPHFHPHTHTQCLLPTPPPIVFPRTASPTLPKSRRIP